MEKARRDEVELEAGTLESTEEQELLERGQELRSEFDCLVHTKPTRVITSLWH
jgi:hypothetical protein